MIDLEQPYEVLGVYDNKGYTMDNYSIWLLFETGETYLIATNNLASIFDIGEDLGIDIDALNSDNEDDEEYQKLIGNEIDWEELSLPLRKTIINYFETEFTYN